MPSDATPPTTPTQVHETPPGIWLCPVCDGEPIYGDAIKYRHTVVITWTCREGHTWRMQQEW